MVTIWLFHLKRLGTPGCTYCSSYYWTFLVQITGRWDTRDEPDPGLNVLDKIAALGSWKHDWKARHSYRRWSVLLQREMGDGQGPIQLHRYGKHTITYHWHINQHLGKYSDQFFGASRLWGLWRWWESHRLNQFLELEKMCDVTKCGFDQIAKISDGELSRRGYHVFRSHAKFPTDRKP